MTVNFGSHRMKVVLVSCLAVVASMGAGGCSNKPKAQELELATLRDENDQLRQQSQQAQDELAAARSRATELESEVATLKSQPPAPAPSADTGGSGMTRDRILTIAGDVAFGPGSTTLTAAGKRELDRYIDAHKVLIRKVPLAELQHLRWPRPLASRSPATPTATRCARPRASTPTTRTFLPSGPSRSSAT